jgi:hypothetical protein
MLVMELKEQQAKSEYQRRLDEALAGSFAVSDPLPWTFGAPAPAAIDVVVAQKGAYRYRRLFSVLEAMGLVMLIPVAILAIGIPLVVVARWTVEALVWAAAGILK